jgi:hypothetical protein
MRLNLSEPLRFGRRGVHLATTQYHVPVYGIYFLGSKLDSVWRTLKVGVRYPRSLA